MGFYAMRFALFEISKDCFLCKFKAFYAKRALNTCKNNYFYI